MRQSSAEFSQLLVKAGRGVGLLLGLAEDLVYPGIWLQTCGFPGDAEILGALTALDEEQVERRFPDLSATTDFSSASRVSGVYLAATACDLLQLNWPAVGEKVLLPKTESPLLVAAALALSSRSLRRESFLSIRTSEHVFFVGPSGEIVCVKEELEHQSPGPTSDGVICLLAQQSGFDHAGTVVIDAGKETRFHDVRRLKGLCANPDTIARLKVFADRLLVPESEHSLKFGAGAGIVDSD